MKYRVLINLKKQEGLLPLLKPFFDEIKVLGGEVIYSLIVFPDTVIIEDITAVVKKYREYVKLVPYE